MINNFVIINFVSQRLSCSDTVYNRVQMNSPSISHLLTITFQLNNHVQSHDLYPVVSYTNFACICVSPYGVQ